MANPYLGEIRPFGGNFAPRNWAMCNGQLLSIAQNTALFSLLGTTYGGNGQTTFGLPDLRGRTAVGQGQGPGLTDRPLGQMSGSQTVTLISTNMPSHNHTAYASNTAATASNPDGLMPAQPDAAGLFYLNPASTTFTDQLMPIDTLGLAGGNQPHNNIMPTLAITYIIALQGIFPSRN